MLSDKGKLSPETMVVRKVPDALKDLVVNPLSAGSVNAAASKIRHETLGGDIGVNQVKAYEPVETAPKLVNKPKIKAPDPIAQAELELQTQSQEQDTEPDLAADDFDEDESSTETINRKKLNLDELDADEIEIEIDGEVYSLSKDDLKSGVGLYEVNNKKARELANQAKALEAERATVVAQASQELDQFHNVVEQHVERNRQIDELLEKAWKNNYDSFKWPDGTVMTVAQLEKEQKANELAIRRLERERDNKQEQVQALEADYRDRQWEVLRNEDPTILDRMDDLASYLRRQGFSDSQAERLARNSDARVIKMIDKARKFDSSLTAKPQKKMVSKKTEIINQSVRRTESRVENPVATVKSQWHKVLSAGPGHARYKDALQAVRQAERRIEKNNLR
ncbi:MAG: hypothetical protein ORN54_10225 [Cyclobacteriaceae bacterium]|nr:hypothetical protein [Cyclobacteriaceae bacterium]